MKFKNLDFVSIVRRNEMTTRKRGETRIVETLIPGRIVEVDTDFPGHRYRVIRYSGIHNLSDPKTQESGISTISEWYLPSDLRLRDPIAYGQESSLEFWMTSERTEIDA